MRPGVALVGNAAHALHPVAGQGFNLALRWLMALVDAFRFAQENNLSPGDLRALERYRQQHATDQQQTIGFSDSLIRLFGGDYPVPGVTRNAGLTGLDLLPVAKHWFARRAMGVAAVGSRRQSSDHEREHWQ